MSSKRKNTPIKFTQDDILEHTLPEKRARYSPIEMNMAHMSPPQVSPPARLSTTDDEETQVNCRPLNWKRNWVPVTEPVTLDALIADGDASVAQKQAKISVMIKELQRLHNSLATEVSTHIRTHIGTL